MDSELLYSIVSFVAVVLLVIAARSFVRPGWGILVSILTMPIYWVPPAFLAALSSVMSSPQIPVVADVFVTATFAGVLLMRQRRSGSGNFPVITFALGIFVLAAIVSTKNSVSIPRSAVTIATFIQLGFITFAVERTLTCERDLYVALRYWMYSYVVVLACGVLGVISLYVGFSDIFLSTAQVRSTFRFPNQLSLYLIITASVASAFLLARSAPVKSRRLAAVSIPVMLLVLMFSGSRSGLAGMGAAAATLLVLHGKKLWLWIPAVFLVMAGLALSVAQFQDVGAWQKAQARYESLIRLGTGVDAVAYSFYSSTNPVAWESFFQHPIVGAGIGAVVNTELSNIQAYEIHNTYLGILGQTGLFGAVAAALAIWAALRNLFYAKRIAKSDFLRALSDGCLAALAGCAVHGIANFDWRIRHVWLLIAFTSVVRMAADQPRAVARTTLQALRPLQRRVVVPGLG